MIRVLIVCLSCLATGLAFAQEVRCPDISRVEMPEGRYSPRNGVTYVLEGLSARMVPSDKKLPRCLIKISEIESGRVRVSAASLTTLLQRFRAKSVSDLRVEFKDSNVVLAGKIRKAIPIPFEIEGPVTAQGESLALKAEKVDTGPLPIKGFLEMFGTELDELLGVKPGEGVTIRGNTLYFRPEAFGNLRGRFASAAVSSGMLVVEFSNTSKSEKAAARGKRGVD